MASHFSIFSVFLLLTAISSASAVSCTLERYGKLTMFVGDTQNVEIPCRYRLADYTCGDYKITVTGRSVKDGDEGRFSPDRLRVRVKELSGSDPKEWVGFTSSEQLQKRAENNEEPAWTKISGDLNLHTTYQPNKQAAVLKFTANSNLFKVEFSTADGMRVVCNDATFSSPKYPETLCGDGETLKEVEAHKADKYTIPNISRDQVIAADILGQTGITQSANCQAAAQAFQSCGSQNQVAKKCMPIFTERPVAKCLVDANNDLTAFENCQAWICNSDTSACQDFRNAVEEKCTAFEFEDRFPSITC